MGDRALHPIPSKERYLPVDAGALLIGLFMVGVAAPAFVYSWKEAIAARKR